jgi:hypothetical protein
MFRRILLVTTALIAASISAVEAQAAPSASRMRESVANRDVNDEFLCSYGYFDAYYKSASVSDQAFYSWVHVAVPITGHGKTVSRIIVRDYQFKRVAHNFSASIYSNTPSGVPGSPIAGGVAAASSKCADITVSIPPVKLENRKKYWVVEEAAPGLRKNAVLWAINPKSRRRAYEQRYFSSSFTSGYTSPWYEQSAGPYVKVK